MSNMQSEDTIGIRLMVVGEAAVGKTCLLISHVHDKFPEDYVPAVFDTYAKDEIFEGKPCVVQLSDNLGKDLDDRQRFVDYYSRMDVFLVCFSVISPASLERVREKWVSEITHHFPNTPFLLVGTQIDLRDDATTIEKLSKDNQSPITFESAEKLAQELKAVKYVECSARTQEGLKNVFDEAIRAVLQPPSHTNRTCHLL